MVMVKEGLELANSNGSADHSGYVDELGVCGSDRFEKCLARSSMVTTAIRRHSLVDVSKTCRSDGKITYERQRKVRGNLACELESIEAYTSIWNPKLVARAPF